MTDCKTIIVNWLRGIGADGLCEPASECGCGLDDFAPCGDGPFPNCQAARSRVLEAGEHIGDAGPGDTAYFAIPDASDITDAVEFRSRSSHG